MRGASVSHEQIKRACNVTGSSRGCDVLGKLITRQGLTHALHRLGRQPADINIDFQSPTPSCSQWEIIPRDGIIPFEKLTKMGRQAPGDRIISFYGTDWDLPLPDTSLSTYFTVRLLLKKHTEKLFNP
ncbi:hypothetical protein AGR2A_Cc30309 [Agrobacterium genomosp. 2 str. CFBP 5494]|uniref:Uncharacterized protein n=1 Tax=Agrobacterium genomosp. 2 str. CFBP 5494 TaxID=1183436 RepID=A0A9W5B1Z0_9HYPH|nr:hypothetical protein AGR2A_Cc30309 [Agrobacterium genomosp. 2 str. CFBP 5494]